MFLNYGRLTEERGQGSRMSGSRRSVLALPSSEIIELPAHYRSTPFQARLQKVQIAGVKQVWHENPFPLNISETERNDSARTCTAVFIGTRTSNYSINRRRLETVCIGFGYVLVFVVVPVFAGGKRASGKGMTQI